MAQKVRVGSWLYRIDPNDSKSLQRTTFNSNSWSRVTGFNGLEILDLMPHGNDVYVMTERYDYIWHSSGNAERVK